MRLNLADRQGAKILAGFASAGFRGGTYAGIDLAL